MKKMLLFLSVAALMCSCSSGPEKVARNFTENLLKGNITEAKKYATPQTGMLLDMTASLSARLADPDYKFEMIKDSIADNRAWVTYKNEKGKEAVLYLVKIDGKWLVSIDRK